VPDLLTRSQVLLNPHTHIAECNGSLTENTCGYDRRK